MYRLPPVCEDADVIKLPDCMYKMKNINIDESCNGVALSDGVSALQRRQLDILDRLEQLRALLSKSTAGILSSVPDYSRQGLADVRSVLQQNAIKEGSQLSLSIFTSPRHPPTSLLALLPWLHQRYGVVTSLSAHTHSSVINSPSVAGFDKIHADNAHLKVVVSWKEVGTDPVLVLSPLRHVPIRGEINIARYLLQLVRDTDNVPGEATELDALLDLAHVISRGTDGEKRQALNILTARMGQSSWIHHNTLSVSDIVLWNALQQSRLVAGLNDNLKRWFVNCSKQPVFQPAVTFFANK